MHTTGCYYRHSNDTVTCITNLYCNAEALHRSFSSGVLSVGCIGISRVLFGHVIPLFFLLRSWKAKQSGAGAKLLFLSSTGSRLSVDAVNSSLFTLFFSRSVWLSPTFLHDGGGYYWKYEHQKVGHCGSNSAFVPGVFLHGRWFDW